MRKNLTIFMIATFAITLSLSSFAPSVIADSNPNKPSSDKIKVQEFGEGTVMQSSGTTSVCHVPKGNPENSHEIVISTSSLTTHLNHGDYTGTC